jgi:hypothetical protein
LENRQNVDADIPIFDLLAEKGCLTPPQGHMCYACDYAIYGLNNAELESIMKVHMREKHNLKYESNPMEILTKCYSGNTWTEFYDDQNIPNLWYR